MVETTYPTGRGDILGFRVSYGAGAAKSFRTAVYVNYLLLQPKQFGSWNRW
jgi:hypothetical protein